MRRIIQVLTLSSLICSFAVTAVLYDVLYCLSGYSIGMCSNLPEQICCIDDHGVRSMYFTAHICSTALTVVSLERDPRRCREEQIYFGDQ